MGRRSVQLATSARAATALGVICALLSVAGLACRSGEAAPVEDLMAAPRIQTTADLPVLRFVSLQTETPTPTPTATATPTPTPTVVATSEPPSKGFQDFLDTFLDSPTPTPTVTAATRTPAATATQPLSPSPTATPCPNNSYEGCFSRGQMRDFVDLLIPLIRAFFESEYTDFEMPEHIYFVPEGRTGPEPCEDAEGEKTRYSDLSFEYCTVDKSIYLGQVAVWHFYSKIGDAAVVVAFAHEMGHHLQLLRNQPEPRNLAESVTFENQADCIAGAWARYAGEQGWLEYPDDVIDISLLLREIASLEYPGRDHGTLRERASAFDRGNLGGLAACNSYYPLLPLKPLPSDR